MPEKVLELAGVSKMFHTTRAVDNISFEIYEGEILGLLGPNGAGKTTTLRMIVDIITPDEGEIKFIGGGIDKKKMGYLPEERGLYQNVRVRDMILYFASLNDMGKNEAGREADRWLERFDLNGYENRKTSELSKGMQQKVQFVVSMIHRPRVLILDELFSGLDPVNQELFKDILGELVATGTTILLSSHRMNMVEELCDRIFMINEGRRVLYGSLREIKEGFGRLDVEMWIEGDGSELLKDEAGIQNLVYDRDRGILNFSLAGDRDLRKFVGGLPGEVAIKEIDISFPDLHSIFVSMVRGGEE